MTFSVAIIGRPNVGKSTLFNRLVGKRVALVDDTPGVTRDRREGEGRLGDLTFKVIDTAGLEKGSGQGLAEGMRAQTEQAIEQADVCLFMIDVRSGVTPLDAHFAQIIRKSETVVILLANKYESSACDAGFYEAFGLGLGEPLACSSEHGQGMGDLHEALQKSFLALGVQGGVPLCESHFASDQENQTSALKMAIVGRPNVGKSTLINTLLDEHRVLVGPQAGITRDSIAVDWEWQGRKIKLFDTAGMRRRARVVSRLEKLSVSDTLRAIRFAEVVVLLMDVERIFDKQDLSLADLVIREGRGIVLALNKWDLAKNKTRLALELQEKTEQLLPQVRGVPFVRFSALSGKGLENLMPAVEKVYEDWNAKVKTPELNQWLSEVVQRHPPPAVQGKHIRLRYMTQTKSRPPTFVLFASRASRLPESYKRYIVNSLRASFGFDGVPIRLQVRGGKNPYV